MKTRIASVAVWAAFIGLIGFAILNSTGIVGEFVGALDRLIP